MTEEFKKGDKVEWNTSQGKTTGEVKKEAYFTEDNPEYLVESDKTGKEAAHKPDALKKVKENPEAHTYVEEEDDGEDK